MNSPVALSAHSPQHYKEFKYVWTTSDAHTSKNSFSFNNSQNPKLRRTVFTYHLKSSNISQNTGSRKHLFFYRLFCSIESTLLPFSVTLFYLFTTVLHAFIGLKILPSNPVALTLHQRRMA